MARELIFAGIQELDFPSAVGGDDNLVVYRVDSAEGRSLYTTNEK